MDEITAEYSASDFQLQVPMRVDLLTTVAARTDMGRVRENNEDKFEFFVAEGLKRASHGSVFLVCDGMGGHAAGQIASELGSKTFLDVYYQQTAPTAESRLLAAIQAANRHVLQAARAIPGYRGMGCTLSGVVLIQDAGYVVQVGDSRVYRLRQGVLDRLTEDHTWVDEALKNGIITAEEAPTHKYRHVLTRAIGTEDLIEPHVIPIGLETGDTFLICSDGVTNHVSDEQIGLVLEREPPSNAARELVNLALAGGGSDNATALIVRIDGMMRVD